jgi:dephospho-CoA kinase
VYLIGLTGGIASGKTVVASRLAEHGAVHIDADVLAREVVEPGTPGLAAIVRSFGEEILNEDGTLDRAALGAIVFSNPEQRSVLNSITHPEIKRRSAELIDQANTRDPHAVVVYDVPLLVEAGVDREHAFDLIVVVHAAREVRIQRLVDLRGFARDEAAHRLNSQVNDTERLAVADVVIDTNGSLPETLEQADALWRQVAARA